MAYSSSSAERIASGSAGFFIGRSCSSSDVSLEHYDDVDALMSDGEEGILAEALKDKGGVSPKEALATPTGDDHAGNNAEMSEDIFGDKGSSRDVDICGSDSEGTVESSSAMEIDESLGDCTQDVGDAFLESSKAEELIDIGHWVNRDRPLNEQAQVLIGNAVLRMKMIPQHVVKAISQCLAPERRTQKQSYVASAVAALLRIGSTTVEKVLRELRRNDWRPKPLEEHKGSKGGVSPKEALAEPLAEAEHNTQLTNVVRVALSSVVEGLSFVAYERMMYRMSLANADVGAKYFSRRFVAEVTSLSSLVLQELDGHDWNQPLAGLGIAPDFAVLVDPVSIGLQVRQRHDTLCVICICLVSRHTGALYSPMLAAPPMPFGSHGGEEMSALILKALAAHPAGWKMHALRRRCSSICGDGALCIGGPEHRHSSSAAAEKMWKKLHPSVVYPGGDPPVVYPGGADGASVATCTSWDPFHRADNAAWRAIGKVPLAVKVFDVSKQLDGLFAQSEGLLLFRGVAAQLGEQLYNLKAPGGTRKVVFLSGTPSNILKNYRTIMASLHGRVAWNQAGHRNQSIDRLLEMSRTLSDVRFVSFLLTFSDVLMRIVSPFALRVQAACEPAVMLAAQHCLDGDIVRSVEAVRQLRVLLRVACLCQQHAPPEDLRRLVEAHLCSGFGRHFPTFMAHIGDILFGQGPQFRRTCLLVFGASDRSQVKCIAPHCQCGAREAFHRQAWEANLGDGRQRRRGQAQQARHDGRDVVRINVRGAVRALRVPLTVKFGHAGVQHVPGGLEDAPPRFWLKDSNQRPVPGLDMDRMYRAKISRNNGSRCQVPHSAYLAYEAVDEALASTSALLHKLRTEFHEILTTVGCNDDMSELLTKSAMCWDWETLAVSRPTAEHVRAFRDVALILRCAKNYFSLCFPPLKKPGKTLNGRTPQKDSSCDPRNDDKG